MKSEPGMNGDVPSDTVLDDTVLDDTVSPNSVAAIRLSRQLLFGGFGAILGVALGLSEALPPGPIGLSAVGLSAAGVLQMLWATHRLGRLGPS